jgi:hypothetical protein
MAGGVISHPNESDPKWHRPLADLESGLGALPPAGRDTGCVALIVRRPNECARVTVQRVRLTPEEGIPDDQWNRGKRTPDAQLAVMRRDVAELIAHGQPLTVFGDNLFVDLDISTANLPPGTRLRVGEALIEVTPMPHDGCKKFNGRFGNDAFKFVQAPRTRPLNLRGVYWKVIEAGDVSVGDPIYVLRRGLAVAAEVTVGGGVPVSEKPATSVH